MTERQKEIAEMFRQEQERVERSHQEAMRSYRDFMVLCYRSRKRTRVVAEKTPKVRQHLWGKRT